VFRGYFVGGAARRRVTSVTPIIDRRCSGYSSHSVSQSVSLSLSGGQSPSSVNNALSSTGRSTRLSVGRSLYDAYEKTRCDGGGGGVTVA